MANMTVKNLPDDLYERLKQSASAHRRSINSELIICLEQVLLPAKRSTEDVLQDARKLRARVLPNHLTDQDIRDAKNQGRA